MTDRERSIALLTEIRDGIREVVSLLQRNAASGTGTPGGAVATDLDGPHGDPQIRMKVRDWSGPDMKGKRASQCPPEFLDLYADALEWAAGKDAESSDGDKRRYAPLKRKDAARCRGWAKRIREGKHQAPPVGAGGGVTGQADDDWSGDDPWS